MAGTATSFNVSSASTILSRPSQLIDVDIPITVQLKVVDVDPGLKGDTAQGGGTRPATLDTGAVVYVPLFVNVGDEILVDTRTGQYMTRAEKN
ncbi:hypothetical protein D8674_023994 [Pyrus ussuriensis x Pyrus communis]|uniref:Elongation factor P C-terminal domain-containing protein n=1 Tax=Pyrus ussuriensis x Pyrus communis TaxID=2448454 RepID=A0A5N5H6S0_9ROSA|nr:hypothetical protein D8674_023994 [Pyrus ussuriensis x Pyrus communis]